MGTTEDEKTSPVYGDPSQSTSKPLAEVTRPHVSPAEEKIRPKQHRWYLGGLASAGAAAVTHPLDLLKVTLIEIMTLINEFSSV